MIRFNRKIQGTRDSDNYATPRKFYDKLNKEFKFDLDPCPLKADFDGLLIDWKGVIFCNPPYSNITPFIRKGLIELEKKNAKKIVYLLPARTDTQYWHDMIMLRCSEIRFVRGRLNFNESKSPAPFPVVIVVFKGNVSQHGIIVDSIIQ